MIRHIINGTCETCEFWVENKEWSFKDGKDINLGFGNCKSPKNKTASNWTVGNFGPKFNEFCGGGFDSNDKDWFLSGPDFGCIHFCKRSSKNV
jgi:hypothetical protein